MKEGKKTTTTKKNKDVAMKEIIYIDCQQTQGV